MSYMSRLYQDLEESGLVDYFTELEELSEEERDTGEDADKAYVIGEEMDRVFQAVSAERA